ncbi:hypothetical protein BKA62DRAFT_708086 [Auriculariales sp. MPI-PUGE-AT-0066]|nr:hypothetical protein BKA62DRAFT_708086 [Auriculariales sp. MPI-PUGE-AT-0066]
MFISHSISLSIILSISIFTVYAAPTLSNETTTLESRQILHLGDKDDFWCDRVAFKDAFGLGDCNGTPEERDLYFTGLPAKITAKTNLKRDGMMRVSRSGTGSGVRMEFCDRMVPLSFVLRQLQKSGACAAAAKKIVGGRSTIQTALEKVDSKFNRRTMQRDRLLDIKKALLLPGRPVFAHNINKLDLLAVMHYILKQRTESLAVARRVDQEIQFTFHIAANVENEWTKILFKLQKARTKLLAQVQREIDQAKGGCDSDVEMASPGAGSSGGGKRLQTRYRSILGADTTSGFSAVPLTSLQRRAAKTPRAGPKAPPCPTCPKKGQKPQTGKKMVPRSQVREKPKPATKPRKPVTKPNPRPRNPAKKTVQRPATRPLRAVGKQAKPKRAAPRRKPKTVPKPTKRPRGKPRSRRGRK